MAKKNTTENKKPYANVYIHIPIGLPGAGKTTYYRQKAASEYHTLYVDIDSLKEGMWKIASPAMFLKKAFETERCWQLPHSVYIDGFFKNEAEIVKFLKETYNYLVQKYPYVRTTEEKDYYFIVCIDYWKPDRELCLFNDRVRNREHSAEETIKTENILYPDVNKLNKLTDSLFKQIFIENHQTQKADVIETILSEYSYYTDRDTMKSPSWNIKEEVPADFEIFDEVLFFLKPDVPYLLYKKIWKESKIKMTSKTDYDYYSSNSTTYTCFECRIDDFKKALIKYGILKEDK